MFSLTIVFGPGPTMWQLLFKTLESAKKANDTVGVTNPITDDFGHTIKLDAGDIHATLLEDLEISKMGHIELALHQARTQAKANTMGQADPALRAAGLMNAGNGAVGPAMLAPGFGRG